MSGLRRALERRWPSAARSDPRACERGFTALELITVLAILAVVFTIVTSLFISFNQQTTNTQDSVVGIQEETQAQQTLIQYLRGASQLLPVYNSCVDPGWPISDRARRNNIRRLQYEHL